MSTRVFHLYPSHNEGILHLGALQRAYSSKRSGFQAKNLVLTASHKETKKNSYLDHNNSNFASK